MKTIKFVGTSLKDIRNFPDDAKMQAGFQLRKVQEGKNPSDWKPMNSIGAGVKEIRIHTESEYRVIYVAKLKNVVYVLHVFQKKTQKMRKRDLEVAKQRYKTIANQ